MKLKHLLENSTEQAYAALSKEERKKMYETIRDFNHYRKSLKAECVYNTAQKIMEAVSLAERYALKNCNEWMQAKMIQRDMKQVKGDAAKLYAEAQKIKEIEQQLEVLYEQIGLRLENYFEIAEIAPAAPTEVPVAPPTDKK